MISMDTPQADATRPNRRAWGTGRDTGAALLSERFGPVFDRIRAGAVARELDRELPFEAIGWLKQSGFTALRLPRDLGGTGASLPELFALLIELSQADSNVTQALRAHLGFVEHVLDLGPGARRDAWLPRLAHGDIVGGAWSEVGEAKLAQFSTRLLPDGDGWRLDGTKYYTTGSLFADWIHVSATDAAGEPIAATIARDAPGVEIVDDWDGFGQRLTASGTARFVDVAVPDAAVVRGHGPFGYSQAFYQLVHLATLAGIGRAAADEVAAAVAARKRTYSHANAPRSAEDPQILQVAGRVRSAAYCAGAVVLHAAGALQAAFAAHQAGDADAEAAAVAEADLEVAQGQTVVSDLVLDATTTLFDALGASATLRPAALDRHWRNARTIASHNPRIYKDRIVGDFAVNGTPHPPQWRIGQP
jgi:alkylation response protein AidB-like acyl-CoA dehydrogenase